MLLCGSAHRPQILYLARMGVEAIGLVKIGDFLEELDAHQFDAIAMILETAEGRVGACGWEGVGQGARTRDSVLLPNYRKTSRGHPFVDVMPLAP